MFSPEIQNIIKQRSQVALIIWFALLSSMLLYPAIGFALFAQPGAAVSFTEPVRIALFFVAVAQLGVGSFVWKMMTSEKAVRNCLSPGGDASFSTDEVSRLAQRYFLALLISLCCYESAAIIGFVDLVLHGQFELCVLLTVLAIGASIRLRPQLEQFVADAYQLRMTGL